jgi:glycosyltransferase involved in cell wall biosynthesis
LQHLNPDVIHISSIFEGFIDDAVSSIRCFDTSTPISVSHYDLIPLLNPEQYLDNAPVYANYYRQKLEQISRATLLLTISESSLQEALTHLNVQKNRVVNVSTAADPLFAIGKFNEHQVTAFKQRYSIEKSFVMYTGGADVRKNLPRLLSAYAKLPVALRDSHQLVLAGKIPDFDRYKLERLAKAVGLTGGSLVFTGFVPDDEMVQLYSLCKLFVFPSWHEGFGLPALEAMACGAPVIASDNTSLPEVIGWPNAMFDPHDDAAMCRKMMEALTIEAFRTELSVRGMARSKKFSWDITARRAISAFETLPLRESVAPDKVEQQPLLPSLLSAIAKVVPPKISKSELLAIAHVLSQFCKCPTA